MALYYFDLKVQSYIFRALIPEGGLFEWTFPLAFSLWFLFFIASDVKKKYFRTVDRS